MKPQTTQLLAQYLRACGETYAAVATACGVSETTVYRWLCPKYAASQKLYTQRFARPPAEVIT